MLFNIFRYFFAFEIINHHQFKNILLLLHLTKTIIVIVSVVLLGKSSRLFRYTLRSV